MGEIMINEKLLSRDDFRESVFIRDNHKCVVCGAPAQDAHHILERRLWDDGGYYLSNGASVCGKHHIECEKTLITVEQIREFANITKWSIPEHLYSDVTYDKWGNVLTERGRLRGELFYDESVQKILRDGGVLGEFTHYVKYPRTHHVPWSPGITDDDRVHSSMSQFHGKRVIVTKKMDGESTTMYRDYIHARSLDGRTHPSRDWVKGFWSRISYEIPETWRVCGENLYAKHSIGYSNLPSFFLGFSIWDETNKCLSWDDTLVMFSLLGITPVDVIYDGIYDEAAIKKLWTQSNWDTEEGYVVRTADGFNFSDFRKYMGKFVRPNHVQPSAHHWQRSRITPNAMKAD